MAESGILTVEEEVFSTLLDELFPDDEDYVETQASDRGWGRGRRRRKDGPLVLFGHLDPSD